MPSDFPPGKCETNNTTFSLRQGHPHTMPFSKTISCRNDRVHPAGTVHPTHESVPPESGTTGRTSETWHTCTTSFAFDKEASAIPLPTCPIVTLRCRLQKAAYALRLQRKKRIAFWALCKRMRCIIRSISSDSSGRKYREKISIPYTRATFFALTAVIGLWIGQYCGKIYIFAEK